MSWVSPPLTASGSGSKSNAGSGQPPLLGSQALSVPTTPPNVRDVRPSTCLALSDFKDMLRQYRSLDDSINTRLNRALARSREAGEGPAPSLLSSRTTASSLATDLGTSTYATTPRQACAQMWSELAAVWAGREDVIRYCIAITDPTAPAAAATGADARLDADAIPPTPAYGRGEDSRHVLARQLHNELAVEAIVRKRTLDAFKSRCRFFQPDPADERERAMWEGRSTF